MKTRRVQLCWMPPSIGSLKFNVDGAVKGDGQVHDSNLAELLAIKTTLEVFVKIDWKGKTPLIIESDSLNVISSVMNANARP
ncbi:hypothetical protein Godav_006416 [Gossypium davidsonii]|uniref:RNase H type-1 domain-containing protein n=2 Tax=Gossypium TaxID=3633 RepID=A0A7J8S4L9_GOSDV|nr:hypothetical protein [Gossypium davidsonii]MBA0656169.1 hypothetical protein [Gossypium klotzschianum]